jgi:hypothetical protein
MAAGQANRLRNSWGRYKPKLGFWRILSIARAAGDRPHRVDFGRAQISDQSLLWPLVHPEPASQLPAH